MADKRFSQKLPIGISIREYKLPKGAKGTYDERTCTVTVSPDQPEVGKHITVLHELLHAVDAQLVAVGCTKRRVGEQWIEAAAPNLLIALATAGFWRGPPSRAEVIRFYQQLPEPKKPRRKAK